VPLRPGDSGNQANAPPVEVEHLLLRLVDVDVSPGLTYEYRIRLKMQNPNFGHEKEVANPAHANIKELYSPWALLTKTITVPTESFMYAIDPSAYRKKIEEEYKEREQKELRDRLLWPAQHSMAVVELCTWMEEVRLDATSTRREPVGAWVVGDMPVGRGEYVGRKTYVKLPLWSSETNQYIFREVPDKILPKSFGAKEVTQPKGWLVDFTVRPEGKSILVDFEGGKVVTKPASGRQPTVEDCATEMLIVDQYGKLLVKSSLAAEDDPTRKKIVDGWEKWIKDVADRKASSDGKSDNPFDKKDKDKN
jgi:hypothetical protein